MRRLPKKAILIAIAAVAVNAALLVAAERFLWSDEVDVVVRTEAATPTPFPPGVIQVADRRPNSCPTAAPFVAEGEYPRDQYVSRLGLVAFSFPREMVDIDSRLRVLRDGRFGGLVTKAGLLIGLQSDVRGTVRGVHIGGGSPPKFNYVGTVVEDGNDASIYQEVAAFDLGRASGSGGAFVPGAIQFPEPGCYQVFVTVAGTEYGPFGFEVWAGS